MRGQCLVDEQQQMVEDLGRKDLRGRLQGQGGLVGPAPVVTLLLPHPHPTPAPAPAAPLTSLLYSVTRCRLWVRRK